MCAFLSSVNWLEWSKTIFDLLKGIAWPLAILLVVFTFRREVRDRIKDIVSVGPTGAVLQPRQSVEAPTTSGLKEEKLPEPIKADHLSTTVKALVAKIQDQLTRIDQGDQIPALVMSLAQAQIDGQFEFVWGIIFGSQIAALRRLMQSGPISFEEAKKFFEENAKPLNPELYSKFDFDQWSRFLVTQQLVAVQDNMVSLTDTGRDFLAYVDLRKPGIVRGS
ncbi:hypothetical protein [Rhizobium sp. LEGMi135b]